MLHEIYPIELTLQSLSVQNKQKNISLLVNQSMIDSEMLMILWALKLDFFIC